MARKLRAVLDTNILISAIVYKGKPRQVLDLALEENIEAFTSPILLAELTEALTKKFSLTLREISTIEEQIKDIFEIVYPKKTLHVQRDEADNRVLEAAVEGKCDYIVTGDKELLELNKYKSIKIVNAYQFLKENRS